MATTAPANPKRILFVDDEDYVLDGLRDGLRGYRRKWAMSFVGSGEEALCAICEEPHDVVVSDLRMPGMDGATLLARIRELDPSTVRIVLSGHAELQMVARAAGVAHRMLAKPCEIDTLARVIERSCALQEMTTRVELSRRAAGATGLPSVPRLYLELSEVLARGDAGPEDAARIVERDMAMAAKVLQLANSAYFGRLQPVYRIAEAVAYLGLDALRALILQAEAFRQFRPKLPIPGFDLEQLQRHCTRVARLAGAIQGELGTSEDAFTAGLLHDLGWLVLATHERHELTRILATAADERRPTHEVEKELHGVSHAEIGAHLLALWGLPHVVTDAVAHHHHRPGDSAPFDTIAVTYIANAIIEELEYRLIPGALPASALDYDYLEDAGVAARLPHWRQLAERYFAEHWL